jgi:hypothetical protein
MTQQLKRSSFTPVVVTAPQRSEEWFKTRLGNVTASRVSDTMEYYAVTKPHLAKAMEFYLLNPLLHTEEWIDKMREEYPTEFCLQAGVELLEKASRKGYREALVAERITGMRGDTDPYVTEDMKWGIMNEGIALSRYQMKYQKITSLAPMYLHPTLLCGASADAEVVDVDTGEVGNAEIKNLRSSNHLYKIIKEAKMPDEYKPQVQMQMWLRGVSWCDFIGFDSRVKEGLEMFVERIEYDEFYVDNVLVPALVRFLEECDRDERQFYAIRASNLKKKAGAVNA